LPFAKIKFKQINKKMKKIIGLAVFAVLLMTACKEDPSPGTITLNFDHEISSQALELNNMVYISPAGHPFEVARLKYYVSNISFHNTDGTSYDTEVIHYREVGVEDTKALVLEKVPDGTYNKISFVFGLDEATNVDDGLENTLINQNMIWPIPGDFGYHYMKFEGRYDSLATGVIKNFNLHTGATQGNQNFVEITVSLPAEVTIDGNSWEVDMMMDMMEWLQNPNVYDFAEFGQAIMMNQNAQEVLKANGADVWSADKVSQK
jgi:hypothetical protein